MAGLKSLLGAIVAAGVFGIYYFISLSVWAVLPWVVTVVLWQTRTTRSCCGWVLWLVSVWIFGIICFTVKTVNIFNDLFEFPVSCEHEPLPRNNSGLKVFVGVGAKMGSRTVSHALHDIGFKTYHGEDYSHFVLWDWMRDEWKKRDAKGISTNWIGGMGDVSESLKTNPKEVFSGVGTPELAERMSRCKVEAVAMDGLEMLTWPILSVSPDAKVLITDWRTFEQYQTSLEAFLPKLLIMYLFENVLASSMAAVPWGAALRIIDPLVGKPIETTYRTGGPPIMEEMGPMVYIYMSLIHARRQASAWLGDANQTHQGVTHNPKNAEEYKAFFEEFRKRIPANRRMEFNPTKNTFDDLCKFLEVSPCPKSGKFSKAMNTFVLERDFPFASNVCFAVQLFFHFLNWSIFSGLFRFLSSLVFGSEDKKALKKD